MDAGQKETGEVFEAVRFFLKIGQYLRKERFIPKNNNLDCKFLKKYS
jgi:hypothetical protein